ncbi:hypothetical protein AAE121_002314 [Salmonella enterica]
MAIDFDAVRTPPVESPVIGSGPVISSQSSQPVSVVCVDFEKGIDLNSQSFLQGLFIPLFFFFLGMGISSIYSVIKGL